MPFKQPMMSFRRATKTSVGTRFHVQKFLVAHATCTYLSVVYLAYIYNTYSVKGIV